MSSRPSILRGCFALTTSARNARNAPPGDEGDPFLPLSTLNGKPLIANLSKNPIRRLDPSITLSRLFRLEVCLFAAIKVGFLASPAASCDPPVLGYNLRGDEVPFNSGVVVDPHCEWRRRLPLEYR